MKVLLDTHCFLWFVAGDLRLSVRARELIEDEANRPFLSTGSVWEIAIKLSLGRLAMAQPFDVLIPEQMRRNGIGLLSIEIDHLAALARLRFERHRDPFDRLLVAQSVVEKVPLVSADSAFDQYPIKRLW